MYFPEAHDTTLISFVEIHGGSSKPNYHFRREDIDEYPTGCNLEEHVRFHMYNVLLFI